MLLEEPFIGRFFSVVLAIRQIIFVIGIVFAVRLIIVIDAFLRSGLNPFADYIPYVVEVFSLQGHPRKVICQFLVGSEEESLPCRICIGCLSEPVPVEHIEPVRATMECLNGIARRLRSLVHHPLSLLHIPGLHRVHVLLILLRSHGEAGRLIFPSLRLSAGSADEVVNLFVG